MLELLIILLLVLVNALLSGSEMAVVSARRGKLQASADGGSRSAKAVLRLRGDPEQFLATVQVGITIFGILLIAGWLLTFLLGMLQRIAPFLASMHAVEGPGRPPARSARSTSRCWE